MKNEPRATLCLSITSTPAASARRIAFEVDALRLTSDAGRTLTLPTRKRLVELRPGSEVAVQFLLEIPADAWRNLEIELGTLSVQPTAQDKGQTWRVIAKGGKLVLPLGIRPAPTARLTLAIEVHTDRLLSNPAHPAAAVQGRTVAPGTNLDRRVGPDGRIHFSVPPRAAGLDDAPGFALVAAPGAFSPNARVIVETPGPDGLPALLRRQRAVGPVVRLRATEMPRATLEVTVPYDATAAAASGRTPDEMVVLALDEGRTRYRELMPIRVDPVARTLTARTTSLSFFFAGTPGFEITQPDFGRNAAGEVLAVSSQPTLLLAGRAFDERAIVTCDLAVSGWSRLGWFVHEGIPLGGPADRIVRLVATVEGRVAHELSLVVRRPPPRKFVTDPARGFGTAVAFSPGNVPFVSAVIQQDQFREDQSALTKEFRDWQLGFNRPAPYAYWADADAGGWRFLRLMPDAHLENTVADMLIDAAPQVFGRAVALDAAHPEEVRALLSLRDFIRPLLARHDLVSVLAAIGIRAALNEVARTFAAGQYAMAPTVPLLAVADDEVHAVLVAATGAASRRAAVDPMRLILRDFQGPPLREEAQRPQVHAGALMFVRARRDGTVVRERVADDIWCASLALKRHPLTGRPFILALGLAAAVSDEPRTRLMLFERRDANDFVATTVSTEFPIFDADLAFLTDGTPRIIASFIGSTANKPHLATFEPDAGGFHATPFTWRSARHSASDLGAFGRLVADAQGNLSAAFVTPILRSHVGAFDVGGSYRWMVARPDADGWLAVTVGSGSVRTLAGDAGHSDDAALASGLIGQSRRGPAAFAPALAVRADGRLLVAYGNGVLTLATIDRATLAVDTRSIDVDRRTGFAPSLALNGNDVPAIAYKDDFGTADFALTARDALHYFSLDAGNVVPDAGFAVPLAPSHALMSVFAGGFAPYVPLTRATLSDRAGANALLDSILMHRRFAVQIVEGGERVVWGSHWAYYDSHRPLNLMIEGLVPLPRVVQFTIDNTDRAVAEGVEALYLTLIGPLAQVVGPFGASLDAGAFPAELRRQLVDERHFRLSRADLIDVSRVIAPGENPAQPGRAWRIVDPDPFNERRLSLPDPDLGSDSRQPVSVVYDVRLTDSGAFEFSVPPLLTVHDRPRFIDSDGNYAPCRFPQSHWDTVASFIGPLLSNAVPAIDFGDQVQVRWVRIHDARVARIAPQASPVGQQGELQFVLTIGSIWARGTDANHFDASFVATTTGPSEFRMPFTPYVDANGQLRWWARTAQAQLGALEVDVQDWGDLQFLQIVLPFIPFLGGVAVAIADAVIDDIATDRASQAVQPPSLRGFANLLLERFAAYVDTQLPPQPRPAFEAVHLAGYHLALWWRPQLTEGQPFTALGTAPERLNFGQVRIDTAPASRRRLLLTCDGSLPVALDTLALDPPTNEFVLGAPIAWPRILEPGGSEVLTIDFAPQARTGDRTTDLLVRFNGSSELRVPLHGMAIPPPRPVARVEPEILNFGVVSAGQQLQRIARVFSLGDSDLDVTRIEIVGEPASARFFTTTAVPIVLTPGIGFAIAVTYAPQGTLGIAHRAVLRVHSNDPSLPVQEIALFGQLAVGALMVSPLALAFNDSPLAAVLPFNVGSTASFHVYNTGVAALTIAGASFRVVEATGAASPHYLLSDQGIVVVPGGVQPPPALPLTDRVVAPGSYLVLTVMFRPLSAGTHPARIVITPATGGLMPVTVEITGSGQA